MVFEITKEYVTQTFFVKILENEYFISNILPILSDKMEYDEDTSIQYYNELKRLVTDGNEIILSGHQVNIMKGIIRKEKIHRLKNANC